MKGCLMMGQVCIAQVAEGVEGCVRGRGQAAAGRRAAATAGSRAHPRLHRLSRGHPKVRFKFFQKHDLFTLYFLLSMPLGLKEAYKLCPQFL